MCWACEKYGNGTRWYFNPENHARFMYTKKAPVTKQKEWGADPELEAYNKIQEIIRTRSNNMDKFHQLVKDANRREMAMPTGPFQLGQVITLEEAKQLAEMANPIATLACICRKHSRGAEEKHEHEYSCTGLGTGMLKWERWPERYRGGVHFVDAEEVKEWLEKWNKKGMMHSVMTFGQSPAGGPYIGGICNCDYPDCLMIRYRLDYGLELGLLKGHYFAKINYDECSGCGVCVQRCQFGVAKFEVTTEKANIDPFKCFGCGLCATGCPRGAIIMMEREKFPGLREVW